VEGCLTLRWQHHRRAVTQILLPKRENK
jgi:hypothetical protein